MCDDLKQIELTATSQHDMHAEYPTTPLPVFTEESKVTLNKNLNLSEFHYAYDTQTPAHAEGDDPISPKLNAKTSAQPTVATQTHLTTATEKRSHAAKTTHDENPPQPLNSAHLRDAEEIRSSNPHPEHPAGAPAAQAAPPRLPPTTSES